jgi:DNA-binding LacI/PurR family transcriptional regulator
MPIEGEEHLQDLIWTAEKRHAELAREAFGRIRTATPGAPAEVRISPELIVRESCAAPRRGE